MKELVDLYGKMIIGTFTFIGPSFTLLNSLFFRQLERNKEKSGERLTTLIKLVENNNHKEIKRLVTKMKNYRIF